MMRRLFLCSVVVLAMLFAATTGSAAEAEGVPTFNTDVAPIIFSNCVACHREGQVAPMSLTSYAEARPWAKAIKSKVVSREMPPWYADPRYGVFRNHRGLTQEQIDTVAAWADGGAPEGAAAAPDLPTFAAGWNFDTEPDYVLSMPIDIELPADGEIPYLNIWSEIPFEEDKFLEAVELRPGNMRAVHHAGAYVRAMPAGSELGEGPGWTGGQILPKPVAIDKNESEEARREREERSVFEPEGTSLLLFYVPGGGFQKFWPGVGKRIRADRYMVWSMHYTMSGQPETDRSSLGFWFQKVPTHHEVLTQGAGHTHIVELDERVATASTTDTELSEEAREAGETRRPRIPVIPPNTSNWKITGIRTVTDDLTLYGLWPHMHFRGKDMSYLVTYPDGREEVVIHVPNYDFNWQIQYELEEPLKIPAGSTIKILAHYDNSIQNRYNPSPEQEVYWGEQSWDEMFLGFMEYSVDKLDLSLEKPSTEE